jgi:class 3 adenylate cyclase
MANLDLIKYLNTCYGKSIPLQFERKCFSLNESLDPENIQKAISDSIASLGPEFTIYFDYGLPADVVLLFIDVCDFSERYSDLNGEEIGEYFDKFYDIVIPIIYEFGGEIDKIMGDGIILYIWSSLSEH